jgi:hypothetical protein
MAYYRVCLGATKGESAVSDWRNNLTSATAVPASTNEACEGMAETLTNNQRLA